MTEKSSITSALLSLAITFFFTGCEGFKILTVYNKTGKDIIIETRPELPRFKHTSLNDTLQMLSATKIYRLSPDSSLSLLTTFSGLLFNGKIKKQDLPIDYLRIETQANTIIAKNRSEIIELIKKPELKYKKVDKAYAWDDNKNVESIIVRK